jgi:hypothetical protein
MLQKLTAVRSQSVGCRPRQSQGRLFSAALIGLLSLCICTAADASFLTGNSAGDPHSQLHTNPDGSSTLDPDPVIPVLSDRPRFTLKNLDWEAQLFLVTGDLTKHTLTVYDGGRAVFGLDH